MIPEASEGWYVRVNSADVTVEDEFPASHSGPSGTAVTVEDGLQLSVKLGGVTVVMFGLDLRLLWGRSLTSL